VQVLEVERSRPHAVLLTHSSTSTQVSVPPLPELAYPAAHPQVYPPLLFVQVFDAERLRPQAAATAHSLTSTHVRDAPLPELA
jgi:hypothetical protein